MADNFTAEEARFLRLALSRGEEPRCPRCGGPLDPTPLPPRRDVAYVRNRLLLQCSACKLKGVVDRD